MTDRETLKRIVEKAAFCCLPSSTQPLHINMLTTELLANGVTIQRWIPVEERLPEQGERVLATDGGFVGEFYINSRGQWQRYNVNNYTLLMALDILWWIPLPKPPKEEQNRARSDCDSSDICIECWDEVDLFYGSSPCVDLPVGKERNK